MIDEKKIEEAAKVYFNKNIDKWFDNGSFIQASDAEDIAHPNFKAGANWAIKEFLKDLWHDASEEPKEHSDFVYIDSKNGVWNDSQDNYDDSFGVGWGAACRLLDIVQWCYLEDILPQKGGEE